MNSGPHMRAVNSAAGPAAHHHVQYGKRDGVRLIVFVLRNYLQARSAVFRAGVARLTSIRRWHQTVRLDGRFDRPRKSIEYHVNQLTGSRHLSLDEACGAWYDVA